jgi:hypothetical protein
MLRTTNQLFTPFTPGYVRKYLETHNVVGKDINQLIKDFQAWNNSSMKGYDIQPIKPTSCH